MHNQFRSSDEPDEVSELISLPSSSDRIIQPATATVVDRVVVQDDSDERLDAVGRSGKANNNKNRSIVTVPSLPMDSRSQDKLRLRGESHPTPWHKNPLPAIHHGPILDIARPNSVTHTDSVKELQSPAARKLHSIRKLPSIMDDSVTPNTIGDDKTGTFPGLTPLHPFSNNSELNEPERSPIRVNRNFPIHDQPHPTTPINSLKATSEPIETPTHSDHGQNACTNATLPIVVNKDHSIKCDSSEFDQLKTELKQLKNVISYLKFFGVILTLGLLIAIAFGAYFMNIHNNTIDSSRIGPEAIQTNSLAGGSVTYSKLSSSVANTLINADALSGTLQPANTNNLTVSGTPTIGILAGKARQDSSDLNANGGHVSIQAGGSPTNSGSITLSIMTNGSTDASATRRRMLGNGNGNGNGGSSTSGASVTLDDGTILQPVHVVTISSDQTTGSSDVSVKANSASIVASQGHVTVGSEVGNAVISASSGSVQINAGQTIELFTNSTAHADTLPQAHPFDEDYMGELHVNIESVKHKNGHIHMGNSNCTKRHYIVHNAGKHLGLLKNGGGNGNGNSSGDGEGSGNSGCDPSDADVSVSESDSDLYIMSVNNNVNIQGSLFLSNGTIQANSLWIQNIYFTPTNQSLTNSTIDQVESVSLWSYLNGLSTSITILQTNYSQSQLPIPASCNITNLQLQLSATQAVITVQGNEIANLQTVNTALVNSNQIQLNNITNLVSQLSILQTLTNQLINLTTTQSNEIAVLKNNLTFMNNALQSLANNVSSLSSNVNSLESNTNSQIASFTSFTNATNQQIGKLNHTIQDLQLMASTSNNSTLDVSWMNTVDSAVTNLTARMSAYEISATLLGTRVTTIESNITNLLTNRMMMDETIISNLTKQIDSNLTYENVIAQSLATLTNRVSNLENRTVINPSIFNSTRVTVISTSGVYIPSAGVLSVLVELVGGGGGGGGSGPCSSGAAGGAGGGGGGYARRMFSASEVGTSQTVTIGAGGIGGDATGTKGGDGSTTAFGSILSASGGGGGQGNVERFASCGAFGGWGGTGSNGDINVVGSSGGVAYWNSIYGFAGSGGASQLSGSIVANSICGGTNVGAMGLLYGGGGGGGGNANVGAAGGHGASGVVIITEFIAAVTSAENELQQDMAILRTQLSQLNQTMESIASNPGSQSNFTCSTVPTTVEPEYIRYSTPGIYQWIVPSNVTSVEVEVWGGGGGGSGWNGGGGGGGGYALGVYKVAPGDSITIAVGGGGIAEVYPTCGTDGGTSSFGSYISGTGGIGGCGGGGGGGMGMNGLLNIPGGYGLDIGGTQGVSSIVGLGGFSARGGSGGSLAGIGETSNGGDLNGQQPGGGGAAAFNNAAGNGGDGAVLIKYYNVVLSNPPFTVETTAFNSLNASLSDFIVNMKLQQTQVNNQLVAINDLLHTLNVTIQSAMITSLNHSVVTPIGISAYSSGTVPCNGGSSPISTACPSDTIVTGCSGWTGQAANPAAAWISGNGCQGVCGGGGTNSLGIQALCIKLTS